MDKIEKIASFISDVLYKVLELIWSVKIPGTEIRIFALKLIVIITMITIKIIMSITEVTNKENKKGGKVDKSIKNKYRKR